MITNPDGYVSIEAAGTIANDVSLTLAGPVGQLDLTFEPGQGGSLKGGSGISDLSFDIPLNDVDGDGDGVSDVEEAGHGVLQAIPDGPDAIAMVRDLDFREPIPCVTPDVPSPIST